MRKLIPYKKRQIDYILLFFFCLVDNAIGFVAELNRISLRSYAIILLTKFWEILANVVKAA